MPSGSELRVCWTALRMSSSARSIGVPIWSWTAVCELPSVTVELISSTPATLRSAFSIFCVTWFSSSVGAAPGCEITTNTSGKSMSGS